VHRDPLATGKVVPGSHCPPLYRTRLLAASNLCYPQDQHWRGALPVSMPLVAVVGRPNVGKSTLFNRLVGRRIAIVEDTPGVTRDRLYGETEWNGKRFTVVDTGGMLFSDEEPLVEQIRVQAEVALAEADAVLLLTAT